MSWKNKLNGDPLEWLLNSNPWTRYRTLVDLMEADRGEDEVSAARSELYGNDAVQTLLENTLQWFPESVTRHNVPGLSHYGFAALAELGVGIDHPSMKAIADRAKAHQVEGLLSRLFGRRTR